MPSQASGPTPAAILEALPNPILVVGPEHKISFANAAAEDFFETSASQLCRQTLFELLPFASPVLEAVEAARASASLVQKYAVPLGTPRSGGERQVDVQAVSLGTGNTHVVLSLLRRSTAQKIDLQLTHRGAARTVSNMAAVLAHEVKNPLAGIRGAAQLIEPSLQGEDRALVRLICEETDRIRDLVNGMEVFGDERPLRLAPVNIHLVLGRVKQLLAVAAPSSVQFQEVYDPSLPPVLGDHDLLVQAFLNLVKNAVEAIAHQGTEGQVLLTTAFKPGFKLAIEGSTHRVSLPLEVCVHDTGPGVLEDMRAHVFDAFVTSKPQGRGLGLALVAKIIGDHGGVVEYVPRGTGACFRVLLPLHKEELPDAISNDGGK